MAANQPDLRSNDTPNSLHIVDLKSHIDPATTTNIEVNINKSFTIDDADSSTESISKSTKINTSASHSRLSDLAHKVTDLLFSTKRSIDLSSSSVSSSPCNSPVASRSGSTVSLNRLTVNHRPSISSRRGVFNNNHSPNRDNNNNNNNNNGVNTKDIFRQGSHTSLSERFLLSTPNQLPCHFGCAVPNVNNNSNNSNNTNNNHNNNNNNNAKVKETHYVHVEYDPITRKRVLNTYEILKDLGSGQHGKVKLAKDLATDQLVAIKIVDRATKANLGRLTRKGTTQEDKIRKEIAIMKKCSHPHVVKLIEVLDAENSRKIYMVLEYLEKGELEWQRRDEKTNNEPEPLLTLEQTKNIFRDIVSGLEYLHHQGVIHRDIKPSNLLVSKDNVVKISDFGVSFAANLDGNDEFELAKTAGTPAFLAPELCKTDGSDVKVTYKIDIWALGVTLYCLLFGKLPFFADTEFQLFDSINNDELKFPNMDDWKVVKKLPDYDFNQSKDILKKLLKKNPEERIEIDEIKQHPFFLEGLSKIQSKEYGSNWNSKMKIDVSNQEVDEAVMGLGNRIRKRLSDAFKRTMGSSSSTVGGSSYSSNLTSLQPSGLSSLSLRDDCSYIFSESRNKNGSQLSLSTTTGPGLSTTALSKESMKPTDSSSNSDSAAYSDISEENEIPNLPSYETKEGTNKSLCPCDDVNKQENKDSVVEAEVETETEAETEAEPTLETEGPYDFRKELEEAEQYKAVELTVNPSYASLDSYYDEAYSNFLNPRSPTSPNLGYAPVGSFSNRQANNSLMFMRAGGNLNSGQSSTIRKSSPTSLDKDYSNGLNGSRKPQPAAVTHNLKNLRGIKANSLNSNQQQRSPSAIFSNDSSDGDDGPITFNEKPMNLRSKISSNRRKSSGAHKRDPPRAIFIQESDCSSEENDDPIVIKKKVYSSANIETVHKHSGDEKYVAMKKADSNEPLVYPEDAVFVSRHSIYGTKIPLLGSLDPSEEENDSSNSDNDELMLSFSRRVPGPITSHPVKNASNAALDVVANPSMCSVIESEIVDVPSNILQAEENKSHQIAGLSDEFTVLNIYGDGSND